MSTNYFILTKESIHENNSDQIIYTNRPLTFILPKINLSYYNDEGLFESSLIDWCKQFCSKDKLFLDIGAHTGTYSICLAEHCKQVYAFEPQKMTYYALCGSVALSNKKNIDCFKIGLGSQEQCGNVELNIRSLDGGGSSICDITNEPVLSKEIVSVTTLDDFFEQKELPPIGFIKIDVEYNELNVLKGAVRTLEKNNYPTIMFEANEDIELQLNKDLFDFLENVLKYKVVRISGYGNMFLACGKPTVSPHAPSLMREPTVPCTTLP